MSITEAELNAIFIQELYYHIQSVMGDSAVEEADEEELRKFIYELYGRYDLLTAIRAGIREKEERGDEKS